MSFTCKLRAAVTSFTRTRRAIGGRDFLFVRLALPVAVMCWTFDVTGGLPCK